MLERLLHRFDVPRRQQSAIHLARLFVSGDDPPSRIELEDDVRPIVAVLRDRVPNKLQKLVAKVHTDVGLPLFLVELKENGFGVIQSLRKVNVVSLLRNLYANETRRILRVW